MASWGRLKSFLPWFFTVVCGFSFLFYCRFSTVFEQFTSIEASFWSLTYWSFGVSFEVEAGANPLFDEQSRALYGYFLIYSICVMTLAINFFTTIVLDAYAQVQNSKPVTWEETNMVVLGPVIERMYPQFESAEASDTDKEDA